MKQQEHYLHLQSMLEKLSDRIEVLEGTVHSKDYRQIAKKKEDQALKPYDFERLDESCEEALKKTQFKPYQSAASQLCGLMKRRPSHN